MCGVFLIPVIVFAIVTSQYYRRMKYDEEHEDKLQYIYKETKTVVIASVLWASVLQCIRPLRWLPAYSLEYPKGWLENRAGSLSLWR